MCCEVVHRVVSPDGTRKVEVFLRADHTYGFEELGYCPESMVWIPVSEYAVGVFDTAEAALREASGHVRWVSV